MTAISQPRFRGAKREAKRWSFGLLVTGIAVWSLFPFAWQVITSFEPDRDLSRFTPTWLPIRGGTLQHYINVFEVKDFTPYILNSAVVDVSATAIALVFAALAAYSIARLPLPGKGVVLGLVLAVSMFPQISIVTPLYEVLISMHLIDTYQGLSGVYIGLSLPLMVYILWAHFRTIPGRSMRRPGSTGPGRCARSGRSSSRSRCRGWCPPHCSGSSRRGTSCCSRCR